MRAVCGRIAGGFASGLWFVSGLRAVCGRIAGGFAGGLDWPFAGGLDWPFAGGLDWPFAGGLRRLAGGLWGFAVDGYRADDWRVCGWFVVCGRFAGGLRAVYGRFAVDGLRTDCWRVCGQFAVCGRFAGGFAGGLRTVLRAVCGWPIAGGLWAVRGRFPRDLRLEVCGLRLVVIIT